MLSWQSDPELKRWQLCPCAGLNDTVGCLLDCEGGIMAFTKNGTPLGTAFEIPKVRLQAVKARLG